MSRIGKMPVPVPAGVTVDIVPGNVVTVKGPKGELSQKFSRDMRISRANGEIVVTRPTDQRQHRAMHGLTRSLLNNMVLGVTDGFKRTLEIHGVGYRAQQEGKNLLLQVGKSHPVEYAPPSPDVEFEVSCEMGGR